MTNAAIILVNPDDNGRKWILEELNDKPFLHYQLSHLEDDFFKHVVIISSTERAFIKEAFGDEYLGIKITYLDWDKDKGEMGNIMNGLKHIDQMQAFILQATQHFRINLSKGDDFRRMRDAQILLIGKKAENKGSTRDKVFLSEKGKISKLCKFDSTEDQDSYNTNTWLISKAYYQNHFKEKKGSLFHDYLKKTYIASPHFCLACRQYYLHINSIDDIKIAREDFTEYFYR